MAFSIELQPDAQRAPSGGTAYSGRIVIGDFEEDFFALAGYWHHADYQRQWREGLEAAVRGDERSCLITSLHDPDDSELLFWWLLYRDDDYLALQNQLLLFQQLDTPFDLRDPAASVPPRVTRNAEGQEISEWLVPVQDVSAFLVTM